MLVTHQFETKYHNQNINTIIEPDPMKIYATSMRLVGLTTSVAQNLNMYAGVASLIKNITLFDDNIEVERCDRTQVLLAFKNLVRGNEKSAYFARPLLHSSVGYTLEYYNGKSRVKTDLSQAAGNVEGYLDLKDCFGFLNGRYSVDGQLVPYSFFMLKKPRVVIEWDTQGANVFMALQTDGSKPGPFNIPAPSLIMDEMVEPPEAWVKKFLPSSYSYYTMNNDQVTVDAIPNPGAASVVTAKNTYKLNGFEGRTLRRMLIQNIPTNANEPNVGTLISYAQFNEQFQLYLSNLPLLPDPEDSTTKQERVNQTWGSMTALYDQYSMALNSNLNFDADTPVMLNGDPTYQSLRRTTSYGAFNFANTKIKDLQFEYTRSNDGTANGVPALYISFFAETLKLLTYDSDGSAVSTFI